MIQGLRSTSFDCIPGRPRQRLYILDDVKQLNIQFVRYHASYAVIEAPFLVKVKKIPSRKEGLRVEAERSGTIIIALVRYHYSVGVSLMKMTFTIEPGLSWCSGVVSRSPGKLFFT